MNYLRKLITHDVVHVEYADRGSRHHLAKELSPSPSSNDKSHIERTLSRARASYIFPEHKDLFRFSSPGAYSNLYRRELKDYVINVLNYGVGYDRISIY